jgi:hypothetical protein
MTRPRFKRCFISAPFGANTAVLRQALEEKGIRWTDQTSVTAGSSWLDVLDRELFRSDFVCTILPAEREGNILFELGIAYAKGKPILAFIASSLRVPSDILSLTYVRSDPTDPEAVRLALNAFLEHAGPTPPRRTRTPSRKVKATSEQPKSALPASPLELERQTADLLKRAGFIVSEPTERRDQGADFAIWIDELEHSLGNPLLVEVKAGDLSPGRLREAASQLRHYVSKTHGRCALLIYWDRINREFPPAPSEWPLILQLSGASLTTLVSRGKLIQELVRLRNAAVHGRS